MRTPDELVTHIKTLLSFPEVFLQLQELIDKPTTTLNQCAAVVEKDPGITAKVLGLANGAFYGSRTRVETLTRAVNILGMTQLHDLVLAASATRMFRTVAKHVPHMGQYWRQSVLCGLLAKTLAEKCLIQDAERIFLQGLLHDVGHLVLYMVMPNQIRQVMEAAKTEAEPQFVSERRLLGFDYGEVGEALMRAWRLPLSVQETVRFHIEPCLAKEFILESALIHLAWVQVLAATHQDQNPGMIPAVDSVVWDLTALTAEDVQESLAIAQQLLQETLDIFISADH